MQWDFIPIIERIEQALVVPVIQLYKKQWQKTLSSA